MDIASLIASRKPGHSLPQAFYNDDAVFEADMARIWRKQWLFAGHTSDIPRVGDFFTWEVGRDPIIIIRGDDGQIRALHNSCRHRGTLVCLEHQGQVKRLVCPYHQWTYDRAGQLKKTPGLQDIDTSDLDLVPIHCETAGGLIFICLADEAPDFEGARQNYSEALRPHGVDGAKVAAVIDYEIHANWKIVWENNRECHHCVVNHPQYLKANFDIFDEPTPEMQDRIKKRTAWYQERWEQMGVSLSHDKAGLAAFPDGAWSSTDRTALVEGYVTESMDGKRVGPLMGSFTHEDTDVLRMRGLPNFRNHSSCDHSFSTRLVPAGPRLTRARAWWLVHPDAEEGVDYTLDRVLPFWQLTSEQDWDLCINAQRGIDSSGYRPGPYSSIKEYNVDAFVCWYLAALA
jgi:Rieske 2Fe-2S family protein